MKDLLKLCLFTTVLALQGCVVIENQFSALPPGMWRAELDLSSAGIALDQDYNQRFDRDNKLPFLFEVVYDRPDSFHIEIINGQERIVLDDYTFGHNRANGRDSLRLNFPEYGSYILAYFEEDVLEGRWYVPSKGSYSIPFLARHGKDDRFSHVEQGKDWDAEGTWEVVFAIEDSTKSYPAIGEFQQDGKIVTGTFRTETGDYRYLAGEIIGEHLWLSCFDGSHAFLFKSKFTSEDEMTGFFKSGNHYETLWSAVRNDEVELTDPDSLTYAVDETFHLDSIVDRSGQPIDLNGGKYAGKAKVVQVMGSWCPNCKDETVFLSDFYVNKPKNLEILAIGFERANTKDEAYAVLDEYKRKMKIPYDVVWGGKASKREASEKLPAISDVISFPTLIFLNPDNSIERIHTGFNGPATSQYKQFESSFSESIKKITTHVQ